MKNNFKKNGKMAVRFETAEERREIIRILEEQRGFQIEDKLKQSDKIHPYDTRTFLINLKSKTYTYWIQPFVGAAMVSGGARLYSAREFFRIAELGFKVVPRFPVFHIPHAGDRFPFEMLPSVCVPEEEFRRYHAQMSDTDAWRFVPRDYYGGDMTKGFQISRLMCDVERFIGPEEEMEQYGMGFCYEKAFDGKQIKIVTDELKAQARKYYDEHHAWMDRLCERHPRILLFDLHSFSEETLPEHIRKRAGDRIPDVCIGADWKYTPYELISRIERRLDEVNLLHMINTPYSGTFVPDAVLKGNSSCDLVSVMLEFNKKLYCDENGKADEVKEELIRKLMLRIVCDCVDLD
ncbi:MAG: N-formylglutamate amidohydrolase [Clostridia bacterium]|nr:N-formylglutamate amidohydrolase [Clostridia bacterium]MBR2662983.1 N-formylglutamate amidohydrolase [Clostridia bacterium]